MNQLTNIEIAQRLKFAYKQATTSRADVFSSAVPSGKTRNIVWILLSGDGSNASKVTIEKKDKNGSYSTFIAPHVAASGNTQIGSDNLQNPVITLASGENIAITASAGTPDVTIVYWDY